MLYVFLPSHPAAAGIAAASRAWCSRQSHRAAGRQLAERSLLLGPSGRRGHTCRHGARARLYVRHLVPTALVALVSRMLWGIAFSRSTWRIAIMLDHSTDADRGRTWAYQPCSAGTWSPGLSGFLTISRLSRHLALYAPHRGGRGVAMWVCCEGDASPARDVKAVESGAAPLARWPRCPAGPSPLARPMSARGRTSTAAACWRRRGHVSKTWRRSRRREVAGAVASLTHLPRARLAGISRRHRGPSSIASATARGGGAGVLVTWPARDARRRPRRRARDRGVVLVSWARGSPSPR